MHVRLHEIVKLFAKNAGCDQSHPTKDLRKVAAGIRFGRMKDVLSHALSVSKTDAFDHSASPPQKGVPPASRFGSVSEV